MESPPAKQERIAAVRQLSELACGNRDRGGELLLVNIESHVRFANYGALLWVTRKRRKIPAGPVGKHRLADGSGAVGRRGTKFEAVPKLLNEKICCQGCEHVLCMFLGRLSEGDRRLAGSVETVSPAVPRNRCAGRLARTSREEPVVDLLKRVASVAWSAARERVTARRIRKETAPAATCHREDPRVSAGGDAAIRVRSSPFGSLPRRSKPPGSR